MRMLAPKAASSAGARPVDSLAGVPSLYELVGGQAFFDDLVERFYAAVDVDARLRHMYPDDLTEPKLHLALFLSQFWGGPPTYSETRGHPRLRLRHVPFLIDVEARDAWFEHMAGAVRSAGLSSEIEGEMIAYFDKAATFLINADPPGRD